MRYFLITGLDNGKPIDPYIVITDADFPELQPNEFYHDHVRYYQPITREQAIEHFANGIEIL